MMFRARTEAFLAVVVVAHAASVASAGRAEVVERASCGGVFYAPVAFANNIVYDNVSPGMGNQVGGNANCVWAYSDIGPQTIMGIGNINADPQFRDVASGDLHIGSESPARDTAGPEATVRFDFDLDAHPCGARPDMGADEVCP
jgi:hypothetical protein